MTPVITDLQFGLERAAAAAENAFLLPFWRDLVQGKTTFGEFAAAVRVRRQLTYLSIDTTGACDLKCTGMCYYNPQISIRKPAVAEVFLRDAIREAADELAMRVLAFAGKEPFLNAERLFSLLQAAGPTDGRAYITGIVTNGRHIRKHHERLRRVAGDALLNYIDVSIDSADAQQHDSFRGVVGTHTLALEGLEWIVRELPDVRPTVVSVLRWDNAAGILDLIRALAPSIKYFQIQPIQPPPYSAIRPLSAETILQFIGLLKNTLSGPMNGCGVNVSVELLGVYLSDAVSAGIFNWTDLREDDNHTIYVELEVGGNTLVVTCELFPLQAWRLARITYTGALCRVPDYSG